MSILKHKEASSLRLAFAKRVVIADGAMGTMIQGAQMQLCGLLEPDRIGVELSEEFQLHPEQSTSAIIVHHPEAKYFNAN